MLGRGAPVPLASPGGPRRRSAPGLRSGPPPLHPAPRRSTNLERTPRGKGSRLGLDPAWDDRARSRGIAAQRGAPGPGGHPWPRQLDGICQVGLRPRQEWVRAAPFPRRPTEGAREQQALGRARERWEAQDCLWLLMAKVTDDSEPLSWGQTGQPRSDEASLQ